MVLMVFKSHLEATFSLEVAEIWYLPGNYHIKRVVRPLFMNIFQDIIVINILTKTEPSEIESIYIISKQLCLFMGINGKCSNSNVP